MLSASKSKQALQYLRGKPRVGYDSALKLPLGDVSFTPLHTESMRKEKRKQIGENFITSNYKTLIPKCVFFIVLFFHPTISIRVCAHTHTHTHTHTILWTVKNYL